MIGREGGREGGRKGEGKAGREREVRKYNGEDGREEGGEQS